MSAPGYSGTPQLRKLGIVEGTTLAIVNRPRGWEFAEPLPSGTQPDVQVDGSVDVLLAFVDEPTRFDQLPTWARRIFPAGALWVAWPRKSGGHVSGVNENLIREVALPLGIVDVKVAAIDTDWSGLKLMWRKDLRG